MAAPPVLTEEQRKVLTDLAVEHGGAVSSRSNPDGSESPYELNVTFFDGVNNPNDPALDDETQMRRFLVSQAIPMALVGIPAVYIHCLLGSRNDTDGWQRSDIKRRINREKLELAQLEADLDDPGSLRARVFGGLIELLETRQSCTAFHPNASNEVLDLGRHVFAVLRENAETGDKILALHNLSGEDIGCAVGDVLPLADARDLLDPDARFEPPHVVLPAYGIRWLAV